ncbi:hypothetical protein [Allorhizocola rhizosphaerae]|uniref:hypothetical protein n=1 Tax=Allorhizocola rhizosphaerae TaxID=1872709 RepID=UPI000E3BFFCA|nr:hypothetical protein [Allorhizocola rhizosphaerae]
MELILLVGAVVGLIAAAIVWDAVRMRRIGTAQPTDGSGTELPRDHVGQPYGEAPPSADGGNGGSGGGSGLG